MIRFAILLLVLCFFLAPPPAHAYGDLTTASYMSQVVISAILGGTLTWKMVWSMIGRSLKRDSHS
jgi:hypothetical protein